MNKKILFLGPLYPIEREREIKENSIINSSNAPNVYQWNLLEGLHELLKERLRVINVLPVGTWKNAYKSLFLKDNEWNSKEIKGREIGSINLPFLKQWYRAKKIKKYLQDNFDENTEIIIYSAYMPFLKAIYRMPRNVKITAIITDLPEFYDLEQTSVLKKTLRRLQNCLVYRYMNRVDRFVVLTKQMCYPLHVGNRPWICIEGICDVEQESLAEIQEVKHVIFYSGTLHYQYGIKTLLKAFMDMKREDVQLWICGNGEAKQEIEELEKADNRVKFYGFCTQTEVKRLRNQATILVNPRPNEGEYVKYSFPSKTMEYMASGKPVVMYKLEGIPEEYNSYLNYVCQKGDAINQLKIALEEVLENYEDAVEKALKGKKFVYKNKNAIVQAKKIIKLIEEDR